MCGIFAILGLTGCDDCLKRNAISYSKKMRHRGPDWSGYFMDENVILCHERLSIIDVFNGAQPIVSKDKNVILAVNGEIYNYKELKEEFNEDEFTTESDCEVIIQLYKKYGIYFMERNMLRGMFAFILYDKKENRVIMARDHLGIIPLYIGNKDGKRYVSSEMKSLTDCEHLEIFPPGQYSINDNFYTYYSPLWMTRMVNKELNLIELKDTLESAVISHMMSDVPFGVLLSGGLDSSLVASIAARHYKDKEEELTRLHSFCIGLEGSPDIKAAEEVAKFIGTKHYSYQYTLEEGIDALEDVIYHIESYDVTTVRSSTPMYLLARRIKTLGIKFVLTGEVSDEISGSYAYFKYAPDEREFYEETVRKVCDLHRYDLLRANKSMMAWGVETRVPFGDQNVVDLIMNLDPKYKMWDDLKMEKMYLRNAFDDKDRPYLPKDMLMRKKEQFSDGVGYNWVDSLKEYANMKISDEEMANVSKTHPHHTPKTKEEMLYRKIFDKHFNKKCCLDTLPYEDSVACSTGKAMEWFDKNQIVDPSGRAVKGHISGKKLD
jgi:asparagine synthase (glutamine-hydrolysing)